MLKKIHNYLLDNSFRFTVFKDGIHLFNYKEILSLKNNNIVIRGEFVVEVNGNNLVLNKMLDSEVLITGMIKDIKIIYE